jgi:hypothetical protein
MELSGQLHAPAALPPEKEVLVTIIEKVRNVEVLQKISVL